MHAKNPLKWKLFRRFYFYLTGIDDKLVGTLFFIIGIALEKGNFAS